MSNLTYNSNTNNSEITEKYENLVKPNLNIEEVPISLFKDHPNIESTGSEFQLLDLLHTVILIMTIIILIMVLNIHAAASWKINQYV